MRKPLTKLIVRINSYGVNSFKFSEDTHIWYLIKGLENLTIDLEKGKDTLIIFLSMLLKMDWEKTKKEVRETYYNILLCISVLLCELYSFFICFFTLKISFNLRDLDIIVSLVFINLAPLALYYIQGFSKEQSLALMMRDEFAFIKKFIFAFFMFFLSYTISYIKIFYDLNKLYCLKQFISWMPVFWVTFICFLLLYYTYAQFQTFTKYNDNILKCFQEIYEDTENN